MGETDQALENSAADGNAGDPSLDNLQGGNDDDDRGATPDTPTLEQQLQKERSSRGREVATLRTELSAMRQTIDSLNSRLSTDVPSSDSDEPPVKYITTPEELETYNAWKAAKDGKKRQAYAIDYVRHVRGLSHINPELHVEIEKELLDSETQFGTFTAFKDSSHDALMNYRIAESTVLKRKLAEARGGKPPVRGGGGNPATGITVVTGGAAPAVKQVELDEYAKKFVSSMGEKPDADWVQKSVQREDLS
jgi:hypothetical protein